MASPSLHVATDLLARVRSVNALAEEARALANFVVANGRASISVRDAARTIAEPVRFAPGPAPIRPGEHIRDGLRRDSRDALLWTDLALVQASRGHAAAAKRSMRNALFAGHANRHVLRSAAALHAHLGDPDEGLFILRSAESLATDPWLQSAEIALSQLAETGSITARQGRVDLLQQRIMPHSASELASALASLEAASGHDRKSRSLLEIAVLEPTENAVAQVEVESTRVKFEVPDSVLRFAGRHEAQARDHFERREWRESVDAAAEWQQDQQFSLEAAVFTSFVASAGLEDYDAAISAASLGLIANPNDATLLNNLAFASASVGRVDEAAAALRRVDRRNMSEQERCVVLATEGLVAFRRGNASAGRLKYAESIRIARAKGWSEYLTRASAYLAREEVLGHTEMAKTALVDATNAARKQGSGMAQLILDRVNGILEMRHGSGFS